MRFKRLMRRYARRAAALAAASMLVFSGIANAYCAVDEDILPASHVANVQHSHDAEKGDGCPGLPDPVKENGQCFAQPGSEAILDAPTLILHKFNPAPRASAIIQRFETVAEPVFQHYPRLLN